MRVVVDHDLCESNGICEGLAPEVFRVDDDTDRLVLLEERPDESLRGAVEEAVLRCPRQALSIDEE